MTLTNAAMERASEYVLSNDSATLHALDEMMLRTGACMGLAEFLATVSIAYKQAQTSVMKNVDMGARMRNSESYSDFANALAFASQTLDRPVSALAIGCGRGYAGLGSDHTASFIREILGRAVGNLDLLDITPELLTVSSSPPERTYDLVVTHSAAHFVPNLQDFFRFLEKRVGRDGSLVLGHEPNSQFWGDERVGRLCRRGHVLRRWRKLLRKVFNPTVYVAKAKRITGLEKAVVLSDTVNSILHADFRFRAPLNEFELAALVDPHRPHRFSNSPFWFGLKGLDVNFIERSYLWGLRLCWFAASESYGLDKDVAARLKIPGSIFSAVFRRIAES
jgi:hypothetical protein